MARRKREYLVIAQVSAAQTAYPYLIDFFITAPHSEISVGVSAGWEEGPGGGFAMQGSLIEMKAQRLQRNGTFLDIPGDDAQETTPVVFLETYGDAYDLGGSPSTDRWLGRANFGSVNSFGGTGASVIVCATWDFPSTMCDAEVDQWFGKCQLALLGTAPLALKIGG